ncbi:TBC1 domain family member 5 [Armadillidium nasatum]|uniref:TBC1 domain family member 5 n=1 Tax=Armadillidium nasatum TaxID=96803 RepID=A0A5N5TGS9_9CRUS|nr:TBC1 domain family member 5 [Armadillidium nasatum]
MDKFRPFIPQTTYFLDPLQQLGSPARTPARKISIGIDVVQQQQPAPEGIDTIKDMTGKQQPLNLTDFQKGENEEKRVFGGGISYMKEWDTICKCTDISEYRTWAFDGELSACRFRSICWRVFLNIFPSDSTKWLSIIRADRERYESTRHELMVTPGLMSEALDPNINNPLSQDEDSPWNQYFEDSELKRLIRLDVHRTFPEVDFFQTKRIQEMLVSILFCYARKYPKICYIQGMHEVLAPIAFVLNYDRHVHAFSEKNKATECLLQEIMDEAHLEHDSYIIFEAVMEKMFHWYEDGEPKGRLSSNKFKSLPTQPFARPQDIGPTTKIVQRLTKIHDHLVKKHEPELFAHLNRLEIPPQVYGIRWVRLMFGREFSFTDLLMVWDAIFADSYSNFLLIEYLMVAMLSYIKDQLLEADYTSCLSLLMRYPPSSDVQSIIQTALYFRKPDGSNIPRKYKNVPASLATVGGQQNIHRSPQTRHGSVTRSASLPRPSTAPTSSTSLKYRSPSVDQQGRSSSDVNRRKSPTVSASHTLGGMLYTATARVSPEDETKNLDKTTKVVSGLARLGEKFSKNYRDISAPNPELTAQLGDVTIPTNSFTSSSEGEEDPSFPEKSVLASQRVSAEDVLAVSSRCGAQLTGYHNDLSSRLAQLHVESDFSVRAAMEGISEVIDALNNLCARHRRSSSRRASNTMPKSLPVLNHPLMNPEAGS